MFNLKKTHIDKNTVLKKTIKSIRYNIKSKVSFIPKSEYNSIIPLNVYTCWHTKDLPPLMKQNFEKLN